MPKYTRSVINIVRDYYIKESGDVDSVVYLMKKEHNTKVTKAIIRKWANVEEWKKLSAETDFQALERAKEERSTDVIDRAKEHAEIYQKIITKAGKHIALEDMDSAISFGGVRSARDAVDSIDLAIRGERIIQSGLINQTFVQTILSILVEEIQDDELLKRVGSKLKVALATQNQNTEKAI